MDNNEIQEYIGKGYLHARVIIEIIGTPKEHVEKTLHDYVDAICKSDSIKVIEKEFASAEKQEQEMWSTFVELEFMIKGVSKLIGFCFDYMPASIEILGPEHIVFSHRLTTEIVNDLQAKLHKMDAILKNIDMENKFLKKNMHYTVLNLIAVALHGRKLSDEELSKITGIPPEGLNPFLDILINEKKIKKEDAKYSLAL
ncbi:MAG: hypothetical protein WC471_00170 [Candidatus Woesearchaeota archaeon]